MRQHVISGRLRLDSPRLVLGPSNGASSPRCWWQASTDVGHGFVVQLEIGRRVVFFEVAD